MELHGRRQLSIQLTSIHAAFNRIQTGTYGACTGCGLRIPEERLRFLPETPVLDGVPLQSQSLNERWLIAQAIVTSGQR